MASDVKRRFLLETAVDTTGARKSLSKLGKVAAGVAVGGLFALGYAAVEGFKAFRQEENIVRSFMRTVRNLGIPVSRATREMDRMANRAISLGFDDAETISGMQTFLKLTGDMGKASELTALAWDISRSRQIDLSAAVRIASGVYKGTARTLKDFGIEGKAGMEAVAAARRRERGQAREWARNHPMQVRLGAIQDAWADLVGNLAKGDFSGVMAAVTTIGDNIRKGLFGWMNQRTGKRVPGLIDRVGEWGRQISTGIMEAIGDVDWSKTLQDTLNKALGALAEAARNGTLTNIAVVGTALAGAMFAFHLFFAAARKLFGLPGWAAKGLVKVAALAVGKSFSVAMFVVGKFLSAAKAMFDLAVWGSKAIIKGAARLVGKAFALAMFAANLFLTAASNVIGDLASNPTIRGKARSSGRRLGRITGAGMATGIVGAIGAGIGLGIIVNAVLDQLGVGEGHLPEFARDENGRIRRLKPDKALGTFGAPRGWSWVGEQGPELVHFRGTERVLSNRASAGVVAGGPSVVNLNVSVNAPVAADGARVGADIIRYVDQALGRGHRFRNRAALIGG